MKDRRYWTTDQELPRCEGKISYPKRLGEEVRNKRLREGAAKLRLYHCDRCNYWHLTHSKASR
jgi:hypothetical protein